MEQSSRYKELQKTSFITIIANAVLAGAKVIAGLASGSTAVISDAIDTFSDVLITVMIMIGIKFSNKKADLEHPYGHQRIESLVSLFLASFLGLSALFLGYEGLSKLIIQEKLSPSYLALFVTLVSIAAKEWMFQYTKRKAKKYNSSSMMSDAWHHRSDAISSIAVLIGVAGSFFGIGILDPIATIIVCFIILKAAFNIAKAAVSQLIDHSVPKELCEEIENITLSVEGVKRIDLLRTRISNNVIFIELEISVDPDLSVLEGHHIAENVHNLLEDIIPTIEHCMVHINPMI